MDAQFQLFLACGMILLWVVLSCFVMLSADKQGKNPLLWLLLSILLTPFLAYVVLIALQNKPPVHTGKKKN